MSTISRRFERDLIPYALETDRPLGAAGFELAHLELKMLELHFLQKSQAPDRRLDPVQAG
jgi:hypothetical protein